MSNALALENASRKTLEKRVADLEAKAAEFQQLFDEWKEYEAERKEHNAKLRSPEPSSADLDKVSEDIKAAEATNNKKPATGV